MKKDFEIQALIRTQTVDVEANFLRVDRETKNSIIQRTNMKSLRVTSNDRLENRSNRLFRQTKFAASKGNDKEELPRRTGGIETDGRVVATKNLGFHHCPRATIKPRKIYGDVDHQEKPWSPAWGEAEGGRGGGRRGGGERQVFVVSFLSVQRLFRPRMTYIIWYVFSPVEWSPW